jgi:hypothetical protein
VTTINDLLYTWTVITTQEEANVSADTELNDAVITFYRPDPTNYPNRFRCTVGGDFVTIKTSTTLPVRWTASIFNLASAGLSGTVYPYNNSPPGHPVLINVASGTLTCLIDPDDAPGSQWTGTHP